MYATVTDIIGQPYEKFGRWWADVSYTGAGGGKTTLMFDDEGMAQSCVGAWFLV